VLARTDSRARALLLMIVAALLATIIGGRLVWWQVADRERLVEIALNQLAQNEEIPAERGEIRDRNGELLASSVQVQSVFATPPTIEDIESTSSLLASVLGMDVADVRARITGDDPWVWLRRRVDDTTAERVAALDLPGVGMIASRLDVAVVPVRLEGFDRILHHTWKWPRRGPGRVAFGHPMSLRGNDYADLAAQVERAVRAL